MSRVVVEIVVSSELLLCTRLPSTRDTPQRVTSPNRNGLRLRA
jgi:hypothetical protein